MCTTHACTLRASPQAIARLTLRVIAAVGLTPAGRPWQPLFESDVAATIAAASRVGIECLGRRRTVTGERPTTAQHVCHRSILFISSLILN